MFDTLRRIGRAAVIAALLAGCGLSAEQTPTPTAPAWTPTPSQTATPTPVGGGTGRIAFVEDTLREGDNIWIMDADGKNPTQLTTDLIFPGAIGWSPDGKRMAFGAYHDNVMALYVMDADPGSGSNLTALTTGMVNYDYPAWSPDGERIVFTENSNHLYIVNADGSGLQQLTRQGCCATWSPDGTQIAFSTDRDGNGEIYVMYPDGSAQTNLSRSPDYESLPAWSPDGRFIAYWGPDSDLYRMDTDGSHKTRLLETNFGGGSQSLRWSQDGEKLVFMCAADGSNHICTVDADGKNLKQLTKNSRRFDHGPAFQPGPAPSDAPIATAPPIQTATPTLTPTPRILPAAGKGGRIAFASTRDDNSEIYLMNPDGSRVIRLTDHPGYDRSPAWSPDGERIAFVSNRDDGNTNIFVMDANGSNPVNLTHTEGQEYSPAWSPDGQRILFGSCCDGNAEVYVMNADGSNRVNLTNNPAEDYPGSWSPDGKQIAFASTRNTPKGMAPYSTIFVMNADPDSDPVALAGSEGGGNPVWSPDGRYILFTAETSSMKPNIFRMDATGGNVVQLTSQLVKSYSPTWSPDGQRIAFEGWDKHAYIQIYIMNADGSDLHVISDFMVDEDPAWSPAP